ncbi:hypothetical protein IMSAGC003_01490 [Lachnospiraceae bacterium]|nr:hypothetical protein [Lachnospiraceae bacterium]GFH94957.1 hypothetical protein IMSAGC003_01490 [Lachnospiraceae bacterium]
MKCPLLRKIKTYIGVSLPWYISIPVIMFSIMFPILFGCNTYEDVGATLDRCFSFLAVLTFSNVYYIEIQQKTAEVYNLLPNRRKTADILKRLLVRFLFLTCMIGICFAGYSIKGLHVYVGQEAGTMFIQAFFSVVAVMFLFGAISYLCVNLSANMGLGIGIGIVVWMILISTVALNLPALFNFFSYGVKDDWYKGKVTAIVVGMLFFFMGTSLIDKKANKD